MILLSISSSQSSQIIVAVPKIEVRDRPELHPLEQMWAELSAKMMGNPTQLWIFFSYQYTWAIDVLSRRFRFHDMVEFEANPLFGEKNRAWPWSSQQCQVQQFIKSTQEVMKLT